MKFFVILIILFLVNSHAYSNRFDEKLVIENAFKVIKNVVPKSHPEFWPKSVKDVEILRFERSGVIDFMYTSKNGKFRGNVYCQLSQLMMYKEGFSSIHDTCFRSNIFERNDKAINGFGKQVGIY